MWKHLNWNHIGVKPQRIVCLTKCPLSVWEERRLSCICLDCDSGLTIRKCRCCFRHHYHHLLIKTSIRFTSNSRKGSCERQEERLAEALEVKRHIEQNGCRLFLKCRVLEKGKRFLCPFVGGEGGTDCGPSKSPFRRRCSRCCIETEHAMSSQRPRFKFKKLMCWLLCWIYFCERCSHPVQATVCQLIRREDVKKENSDRRVALMPCFLHSGHNFIYWYIFWVENDFKVFQIKMYGEMCVSVWFITSITEQSLQTLKNLVDLLWAVQNISNLNIKTKQKCNWTVTYE